MQQCPAFPLFDKKASCAVFDILAPSGPWPEQPLFQSYRANNPACLCQEGKKTNDWEITVEELNALEAWLKWYRDGEVLWEVPDKH